MRFDAGRLGDFFNLLPRSTREAALLGRHHDHRLKTRAWLRVDADRPIRHALEVRHPSFETKEFIDLLRQHDVALVVADTAGRWPLLHDVTSDFVYVRLHGDTELYASGYTPEALQRWAKMIGAWSRGEAAPDARCVGAPAERCAAGRDVYVYFDNDVKTHAPFDAMSLANRLGLGPPPAGPIPSSGRPETPRTTWAAVKPRRPAQPPRSVSSEATSSSTSTPTRKPKRKARV
jgi:uncharacterized protein YecE (DUF72 family)